MVFDALVRGLVSRLVLNHFWPCNGNQWWFI